MQKASILGYLYISSSYPAKNVLDYNRNTQCRGSSTSPMRIDIKFSTTQAIEGLIIDIRNYDNNGVLGVDRYNNLTSFISGGPVLPTTYPLLANELGATYNSNKFRLTFNTGSPNVNIGMIALCHIYELTNRHQVPSIGGRRTLVSQFVSKGGRQHYSVNSQRGISILQHKYFLSSLSELNDLESVFKESAEIGLPFVFVDGDNDPLMLFWESDIRWREVDHEVFEATCNFIEVPYAESGDLF